MKKTKYILPLCCLIIYILFIIKSIIFLSSLFWEMLLSEYIIKEGVIDTRIIDYIFVANYIGASVVIIMLALWITPRIWTRPITEKEYDMIKKSKIPYVWHLSHNQKRWRNIDTNNVYLNQTKGYIKNMFSLKKAAIYFFYTKPTKVDIQYNLMGISKSDMVIVLVNISDLNFEKIRIRRYDNCLIYEEEYFGKAKIFFGRYNWARGTKAVK